MTEQANNTEVEATKAEIVKDQKNGVTRPSANTQTGKVWAICDLIYAQATEENPITRSRVIKTAEADEINVSTAATQYGRWRKYMGLERETPKAVVAATDKPKAKKASKAAKEEAAAPELIEDQPQPTTSQPTTALDDALGEEAQV